MTRLDELNAPLDPALVAERPGAGSKKLSYIPSHVAITNANLVFGYGEWGYSITDLRHVGTEELPRRHKRGDSKSEAYGGEGTRVAYTATVKLWVRHNDTISTVEDVGYGDSSEWARNQEDPRPSLTPHELASKEAVSDSVKRCLRTWGPQFGLSLYDKDSAWRDGIWTAPPGRVRISVTEITERLDTWIGDEASATSIAHLCASIWGPETPRPKHVQEVVTRRLHEVLWSLEASETEPAPENVFFALATSFHEAGVTAEGLATSNAPF